MRAELGWLGGIFSPLTTKGTICWVRKDNASQMNPQWPRQIIFEKLYFSSFRAPGKVDEPRAQSEVCDKNATPHYTNLSSSGALYIYDSINRGMTDAHLEIFAARAPFRRAAGGPAPAEIIDVCSPKTRLVKRRCWWQPCACIFTSLIVY